MSAKTEKAVALFEQGFNCAQAVAAAFAEDFGMDPELMLKLMLPLGGGVGRQREVCGEVLGMTVALGLAEDTAVPGHEAKKECYEHVRKLCDDFKKENGSIICRELLGVSESGGNSETATGEHIQKKPCKELVGCAAGILERYLKKNEE